MDVKWIEGQAYDSNIYLIKDELNLLIDSGTGKNFDRVKEEIEKSGSKIQEIDILVNTHPHFDHVGGNQDIIELSGCDLMASKHTAKALEEGNQSETLSSAFGEKLEPIKVTQVLEDGDEIDLGKYKLRTLYTPGHSKGDIVLYEEEERVLFSGDTVFQGGIGRTDLPSSDRESMKKSLERLKDLKVDALYPGHEPIVEKDASKHLERATRFLI